MRLRVKFTKTGPMRFTSHLDIMRYFQKALRRADINVSLSEGFSPHMLMSFALPLPLGMSSTGEYFDVDVKDAPSSDEMIRRLNEQMCEDITVLSVIKIPEDKANKCMSLVTGADYSVTLADGGAFDKEIFADGIKRFMAQDKIMAVKKTKRNEELTDIKPFIYSFYISEDLKTIHLRAGAGSVGHLRSDLVMNSLFEFLGLDAEKYELSSQRDELLSGKPEHFVPLYKMGEVMY